MLFCVQVNDVDQLFIEASFRLQNQLTVAESNRHKVLHLCDHLMTTFFVNNDNFR